MVKLENWWQNFPFFIAYVKMDMNSYLEYYNKKFLSYLSRPQYWGQSVTILSQCYNLLRCTRNFLVWCSKLKFLSILIYGIKSEKKIFTKNIFFHILPPHMNWKFSIHVGGYMKKNIFAEIFFFPIFIPYIKMDKNSNLEYHIKKFQTYLSKSQ